VDGRFKLVPELPEILAYVERISSRPASIRVRESDAELAAKQG
jgi:glutathione S-transferase